ncbi:glycosyltransferase family 4 protein [Microbacterium sp. Au-Mic1]|uniref:glycosyltransferase family 4 protein n=1 Tax=Microbacterium sp. Au-Mic1 TaxID=2906457 RepID=UPI001E3F22D6|nr:glycosyltransferase family 4 protein [Microbacterium sp. Au-Mic1]MCE4027308.1 glycosyltransferase family 4 protein [Microbacterium sp. Au-Mic1]
MTTRRVALITSSYAPHVGGVETHVAEVARALSARGVEVEVWAVDRGGRADAEQADAFAVRYLPTPLPARHASSLARFARRAPGAWSLWARAHRRFRPDALHVHCFGPNGLYALALHRRFGTPLIITSHGETTGDDDNVFAQSALLRRGLRDALTRAAAVTAPSEYVLRDLRARFGLAGGVVVPNGVTLDVVQDDGIRGRLPHGPYLAAVGRLGRMKGFDLLLEALARLRVRSDPGSATAAGSTSTMLEQPGRSAATEPAQPVPTRADARLVIAGDGPERAALQEQVTAHGLEDVVDFLGWCSPAQVATVLAGSRALVVPSRSEAFGIAALEAWRASTALVMTNRGGAGGFVRDGEDGILVDPEDVDALAAAISRVLADPALRSKLAAAGADRVGEFTWERVAERYLQVYTSAEGP